MIIDDTPLSTPAEPSTTDTAGDLRRLRCLLLKGRKSQDFISLLPLTLTMNDLFRREKFARLPRAISKEGKRTHTYKVGDVAYWPPGPDVAIFYRNDGQEIPDPGIIVIGKIDSGVEAFNVSGSYHRSDCGTCQ